MADVKQSVIGSMLMDREAVIAASEIVTGSDFYQQQYGIMFDAMVELFNEGKPVDLVTLQDRLKEKDVPPEVSSLDFVRDIVTMVPTSANVRSYAILTIFRSKAVNFIGIKPIILIGLILSHLLKLKVRPQSKRLGPYLIDVALDAVVVTDIKIITGLPVCFWLLPHNSCPSLP